MGVRPTFRKALSIALMMSLTTLIATPASARETRSQSGADLVCQITDLRFQFTPPIVLLPQTVAYTMPGPFKFENCTSPNGEFPQLKSGLGEAEGAGFSSCLWRQASGFWRVAWYGQPNFGGPVVAENRGSWRLKAGLIESRIVGEIESGVGVGGSMVLELRSRSYEGNCLIGGVIAARFTGRMTATAP